MAGIFARIAAGEIPSWKIAEDERFFAFLDINPLAKGHTLIIPKAETDYIFDIGDEELSRIMIFSKNIAGAIKKAYPCNRIAVAILGLEVPHAHVHLVPMDTMEDINFKNPKLKFTPEEFSKIAANIRECLSL